MRTELLGDDRPAHQFGDGKEFEEGGLGRDQVIAGVDVDAVEKVGLLIVVRG